MAKRQRKIKIPSTNTITEHGKRGKVDRPTKGDHRLYQQVVECPTDYRAAQLSADWYFWYSQHVKSAMGQPVVFLLHDNYARISDSYLYRQRVHSEIGKKQKKASFLTKKFQRILPKKKKIQFTLQFTMYLYRINFQESKICGLMRKISSFIVQKPNDLNVFDLLEFQSLNCGLVVIDFSLMKAVFMQVSFVFTFNFIFMFSSLLNFFKFFFTESVYLATLAQFESALSAMQNSI